MSYDPWITLKKGIVAALPGILAGIAAGALAGLEGQGGAVTATAIGVGALTGGLKALINYLKNADPTSPGPPRGIPDPIDYTKLGGVILLIAGCALFSGCATTRQSIETADGDKFRQSGGALFSKQQYVHGLDADFYPNNSGAHIAVRGQGDQDSTAVIPLVQALVGMLNQQQATPPQDRSRIEQLEAQIAALRRLIEAGRAIGGTQ